MIHPVFPDGERYRRIRRIGAGPHGVVYEAFDHARQSRVALKALRSRAFEDRLDSLAELFQSLRALRHPNLVELHEFHACDRQAYFTMELVEGVEVGEWVRPTSAPWLRPAAPLADGWPLVDDDRLLDAEAQLRDALNTLHTTRHVHGDIKASNVLVSSHGRLVLLDAALWRMNHSGPAEDLRCARALLAESLATE